MARSRMSMHVDDPAALGRRVAEARARAGLTQSELSFPGCSATYISRIEAGQRVPSLQVLRELARRLGTAEEFLATGAAAPPTPETQKVLDADVALRLDETDLAGQLYEEALQEAVTDYERGLAHAGLGQLALRLGDPRKAIEHFENALGLLNAEPADEPAVAASLGRAYAMVGELERSADVFRRAREAAEARGDRIGVIRFAVLLCHALEDMGRFEETAQVLEQTAPLVEDTHDPLLHARLYWTQSRLHGLANEPWLAEKFARKALEILELTENARYTARAHQLLAHIELDRDRPEEALELLKKAWPMLVDGSNKVEQAQFRLEEARALAALGRSEEAAALAMEVVALIGDADPMDAGRAYTVLGNVFRQIGERERARELYELAAELLEKTPNRYLAEVYTRLAELFEEEGRKDEALALLKKAVQAPLAASRANPPAS